jgi:hypothetical protein
MHSQQLQDSVRNCGTERYARQRREGHKATKGIKEKKSGGEGGRNVRGIMLWAREGVVVWEKRDEIKIGEGSGTGERHYFLPVPCRYTSRHMSLVHHTGP